MDALEKALEEAAERREFCVFAVLEDRSVPRATDDELSIAPPG